jgi:hypothetical protein
VLEPSFPGVTERYVDLSCCYDMDALQAVRKEMIALTKACRESYARAYRCSAGAGGDHCGRPESAGDPGGTGKIARRRRGF